jgi:hypothetical protein
VPLTKRVHIELLTDTWSPPAIPPAELTRIEQTGPYAMDVLCALVFTALWTRPPVRYGFSLADTWAWMRYLPALCFTPELRLCEEWTTLDPHQKTVLSGDFGVGFTTWLLNRELGFVKYSDTLWVVNALQPGVFRLGPSTKRGPRKSPDYIAEDRNGDYSVVECKGTQSTRQSLIEAIERGIPQKQNLQTVGGVHLAHSLVAGLFVPQYECAEVPVLIVADPPAKESLSQTLGKYSRDQIRRGVSQVAYAKELATLDLAQTANALVRAKESSETIASALARDLQARRPERSVERDQVVTRREYVWDAPARIDDDLVVAGVRFEGILPPGEFELLRTMSSPELLGELKRDTSQGNDWHADVGELSATLRSPLGSTFRISLLPE